MGISGQEKSTSDGVTRVARLLNITFRNPLFSREFIMIGGTTEEKEQKKTWLGSLGDPCNYNEIHTLLVGN